MELKLAGIMDAYSNILTPDLWSEDGKLHKGIREVILKYVVKALGYPLSIYSIVNMIGSTLTYQYTSDSDIDISLGLKPEFDHLLPELHQKCKDTVDTFRLPGTEHPVNLFVSPSARKLRPENLSGGYDLLNQVWIKHPKKATYSDKHRFDMIMPFLALQKNELKRQVNQLVKRKNLKEAWDVANFFGQIDRDRKMAYSVPLRAGGNYSTQNAVFKNSLKGQDYELIDKLYNKLRSKGLTFSE